MRYLRFPNLCLDQIRLLSIYRRMSSLKINLSLSPYLVIHALNCIHVAVFSIICYFSPRVYGLVPVTHYLVELDFHVIEGWLVLDYIRK